MREALPGYILHGLKGSFIKPKTDVQENRLLAGDVPGNIDWGIEPESERGLLHAEKNGEIIKEYIISERGNYGEFYDNMYHAIRDNKPAPVSAEEGMKVIKIIEVAHESNNSGKIVCIIIFLLDCMFNFTFTSMVDKIREKFVSLFNETPVIVRSPGRINLIGEHTDYNNGFVLPGAIDKAIYFAITTRQDDEINLYAADLDEHYKGNINALTRSGQHWPDYILGSLQQLQKAGHTVKGFNGVIGGDVPLGAGLSSSAAVECASLFAFNKIFSLGIDLLTLVKFAQKAENEFVGLKSGIMDQFASVFGKRDHVIKLDCRSLEYEYVPFKLTGIDIVLFDTNVKHSLASSEYNTRRAQCEKGVELIKKIHPEVNSLRDVNKKMVEEILKPADEIIYRRCAFIVNEIQRTIDACVDLENSDLIAFGKKMFETHYGLSRDYAVSCRELDFLVDYVKPNPAVIGARMMGGGFGGCTINLIKEDKRESLISEIIPAYKKSNNLDLKVYIVQIENGTEIVSA